MLRRETSSVKVVVKPIGEAGFPLPLWLCSYGFGLSEVVASWHWNNMDGPSFSRPVGLNRELAPFSVGHSPWESCILSLCELKRALIRKGRHHCGLPQQHVIATRVDPQTWHLYPLALQNGQTPCCLSFSLQSSMFLLEIYEGGLFSSLIGFLFSPISVFNCAPALSIAKVGLFSVVHKCSILPS